MKKYVPRSIQNIFDRIDAYNESITNVLFSEPLSTTFEVVVYMSLNPPTKIPPAIAADESSSVSNYHLYSARSLSGHHDHLVPPDSARSPDEYERFRNSHFQAIIKKSIEKFPLHGDVWLATYNGGNLVTLVAKQRTGTIITNFVDPNGGPARTAHRNGNNQTQTNASYTAADIRGRISGTPPTVKSSGIITDTFPFFNVDPVTNRELVDFISKGEAIGGSYNSINRIWYPTGQGGAFRLNSWPKDGGTEFLIDGGELKATTIERVMELQNPYNTARYPTTQPQSAIFATGRYQVIPVTMKDHLAETGLTKQNLYNEANQDRFCMTLIYGAKRPDLRDYLLGVAGATLNKAQTNFAQEWSSVPTPAGASYYGGESSSHTTQETRNLLERVKKANTQTRSPS